jgi:polar amino acid transport system substrate-binding protein
VRPRVLIATLLLLATAGCVSPEEPDLSRRYDNDTIMGEIQAEGTIRIGVPNESQPFASSGKRPQGFAVEMGNWMARTLGVNARLVRVPSDELVRLISEERLDIAFPLEAVTERIVKEVTFSDPYYVGHQRLLVPASSGIERVQDLSGKRVCESIGGTGTDVAELVDAAVESGRPAQCEKRLALGRFEAMTAPDVLLMDIAAKLEATGRGPFAITGDQLTTEGYAIAARSDDTDSFVNFLNSVLGEAEDRGEWARAYERWLKPHSGEAGAPPELTLEEAAALYPPDL